MSSCPMQTGTATSCGGEDGDCLKFHGRARVDAEGRTVCDVDEGSFKIAVRGVVGRAIDVAIVRAAIAPGTENQIWSLFMPITQTASCMLQQDAGPEIRIMQKLCAIDPSGNHHGLLVHTGLPCVGLCPELAKIHAQLVARGVTGNFVDFTAKYGLGQGVDVELIASLQWVVMYVTHAGQDIFNFHSRMIYDEKQDKKVRVSWRVLLRGIAEFLRFADKLLDNKIFHLDVSDNNLRYRFDHAIFDDKQITITHLHFSLIDYGWPGMQPSPSRDDLLFKLPHGIWAKDPPCYIMFETCFIVYCTLMKLSGQTVESICEELCNHSFAKKMPETWTPNKEEHGEMEAVLQHMTSDFKDTHTTAALTRMWIFTAKVVCAGIQKYTGNFKQEIAHWPSTYNAYVSYLSPLDDDDAPQTHMPAFVALFNYYRSVYYSDIETFELTATALDLYKRQHDTYSYVQMMSWALRRHSHSSHRVMKTAANLINKLVAQGSTDTLQEVCAKIEAISLM